MNRVSVKDLDGDIDISQKKWDYIFDFLLKKTTSIYFRGTRLEYMNISLKSNIDFLVDQNSLLTEDDYFKVVFKVKDSSMSVSRGLISEVWNHFEYPSIIFLKEELEPYEFKRLYHAKNYDDIFAFVEGMFLIYKNFEPDVLWLEKTMDMEFPSLT